MADELTTSFPADIDNPNTQNPEQYMHQYGS